MKKIIAISLFLFMIIGNNIHASIIGMEELKINFTDKSDATLKATWSEPDKINITENGLGWDGEQNAMKKIIVISLLLFMIIGNNIYASIIGMEELKINFTNKNDATLKATWSEPDKINVTENGLGWDGEQNALRDSWIQTVPLAVGLSWRPAQSVNVTVEIKPKIKKITLPNGTTYTPYIGNMFVRYSPDRKHWSSWQAMDYPKPQSQTITKWKFTAFVNIPQREREKYISYMKKYWKLDVPWVSDEEALVKWILKQDPKFFNRYIPFIGYIQCLYEISLPGGQRITEFHSSADFGLSGLHQAPKDKNVYKERDNIPWRFKAKGTSQGFLRYKDGPPK